MQTKVEFRSAQFPPYEPEREEMINLEAGIWGRRLAEYLAEKLAGKGIVVGQMNPEDWGWYLPVEVDGVALALACGHQYGDDDQFLCFTDPSTPIVRKLFRKVDLTAPLLHLTGALRDILAADLEIRDIVWSEA